MFRSLLPIIYVTIFMLSFASFSLSLVTHIVAKGSPIQLRDLDDEYVASLMEGLEV